MYFEQFYLGCLSHASYMIASEGVATVVDPQRDVALYIEEAAKNGLAIRHIIETHLHADFVSGHRELAALTGATIHIGARAGASFPHQPVKDGDEIRFGQCVLRFLETPGHTPEAVSVLVTDLERGTQPFAVLTGDTLFVGDVGRPDLSADFTPPQLAGMLYDSLHQKLLTLPDEVQLFPAHGAGSLCGRNMSAERSSTIGREKKLNYALQARTRDEFVRLLTEDLPERPEYFTKDVEINRAGAGSLAELSPLAALTSVEVKAKQDAGALVLDTRPAAQFAESHIPGSIQIGLVGQFASWAGTLLGLEQDIILIAEDQERAAESRMRLARVGIERVVGFVADGIAGWTHAGLPIARFAQVLPQELQRKLLENPDSLQVVDVRRDSEWEAGHVGGAAFVTLSRLSQRVDEIDRTKPVAVYCKGGYRSTIAVGLLQRAGFRDIINVIGGFDAWQEAGLPFVTPESAERTAIEIGARP
jgi:glyoxylase-like metal-dependent hydrolase (beta-lactamase superfamily II)/rhodanese-related sulfurtransferase